MSHQTFLPVLVAIGAMAAIACSPRTDRLPPTAPFEPSLRSELHEIRERAATARGLKPNPNVSEGTIAPRAYRRYVERQCEEIRPEARVESQAWTAAWRLLGTLDADDDLLEASCEFNASGWAGFFSFDDDRLVLVGTPSSIDSQEEITLAHEYVHSFQEALIDRDEWEAMAEHEAKGAATEYSTTQGCLLEGDATLSEAVYDESRDDDWPSESLQYWAGLETTTGTPQCPAGWFATTPSHIGNVRSWPNGSIAPAAGKQSTLSTRARPRRPNR